MASAGSVVQQRGPARPADELAVCAAHTPRPPADPVQRNRVTVTRSPDPAGADQPTVCTPHTARPPAVRCSGTASPRRGRPTLPAPTSPPGARRTQRDHPRTRYTATKRARPRGYRPPSSTSRYSASGVDRVGRCLVVRGPALELVELDAGLVEAPALDPRAPDRVRGRADVGRRRGSVRHQEEDRRRGADRQERGRPGPARARVRRACGRRPAAASSWPRPREPGGADRRRRRAPAPHRRDQPPG
jgi:hypothetical protein